MRFMHYPISGGIAPTRKLEGSHVVECMVACDARPTAVVEIGERVLGSEKVESELLMETRTKIS